VQWFIRFLVGGAAVSVFALAGDLLRPKGFAGLFSAAPSVALASLALTAAQDGRAYAALEARSMLFGAVALVLYAGGCVYLMAKRHLRAGVAAGCLLLAWAAVALSLRFALLD
jgi:hypothetical protein